MPLGARPLSLHSTTESKVEPQAPFSLEQAPFSLADGSKGYRLYRRRFAGCFALVVLNIICASERMKAP